MIARCERFQDVYTAWYVEQEDKTALPLPIDLVYRPEIRTVVEQDKDQVVACTAFQAFEDDFAQWSHEWQNERAEELRTLIRGSSILQAGIPPDVDPLSLASVAFTCTVCRAREKNPRQPSEPLVHSQLPLLYPAVLKHECLYKRIQRSDAETSDLPLFEQAALYASRKEIGPYDPDTKILPSPPSHHRLWSCDDSLEVVQWHGRLSRIIQSFGKDPYTTTRDEMDAIADVRLYCENCPWGSAYCRPAMTWRHAVSCVSPSPGA